MFLFYLIYIYFSSSGTPKQRKPSGAKGPAKKVKKRNPWSDDECDDDRSDNELDESEPIIPRDTTSRRASGVCASITTSVQNENVYCFNHLNQA